MSNNSIEEKNLRRREIILKVMTVIYTDPGVGKEKIFVPT